MADGQGWHRRHGLGTGSEPQTDTKMTPIAGKLGAPSKRKGGGTFGTIHAEGTGTKGGAAQGIENIGPKNRLRRSEELYIDPLQSVGRKGRNAERGPGKRRG